MKYWADNSLGKSVLVKVNIWLFPSLLHKKTSCYRGLRCPFQVAPHNALTALHTAYCSTVRGSASSACGSSCAGSAGSAGSGCSCQFQHCYIG